MISNGTKEITLIGQNVNSYRGDAAYVQIGATRSKWRLERLIMEIANIPGLKRLRYTTSHPKDFTNELMQIHQDLIQIMPPFVHIPVQSGNDRILENMNRGYTASTYLEKLETFRNICPAISFSSDFIVGFPGETDSEFEDTVKLAKKANYSLFYAFKYSRRKNTPAHSMPNQITKEIKEKRLETLIQVLQESQLQFNQRCVGQELEVLFEKRGKKNNQYIGKSEYLQSVVVESQTNIIGNLHNVLVQEAHQNCLIGHLRPYIKN
jgi:tRNA-2-methylthio-N6-dimethylallyladenosine synthase